MKGWVSGERHALLQHNADKMRDAYHAKEREVAVLTAQRDQLQVMLDRAMANFDSLLQQTLDLKRDGFDKPIPPTVDSPLGQLGPLTRAALHEMSNGQMGPVKRAMQNKAVALWHEMRGEANQDETVAVLVRNGEQVW